MRARVIGDYCRQHASLTVRQSELLGFLRSKPKDAIGRFLFWEQLTSSAQGRTAEALARKGLIDLSKPVNSDWVDWSMKAKKDNCAESTT